MRQYRCTECTLLRCDGAGETCEECRENMSGNVAYAVSILDPTVGVVMTVSGSGNPEKSYAWTWSTAPTIR